MSLAVTSGGFDVQLRLQTDDKHGRHMWESDLNMVVPVQRGKIQQRQRGMMDTRTHSAGRLGSWTDPLHQNILNSLWTRMANNELKRVGTRHPSSDTFPSVSSINVFSQQNILRHGRFSLCSNSSMNNQMFYHQGSLPRRSWRECGSSLFRYPNRYGTRTASDNLSGDVSNAQIRRREINQLAKRARVHTHAHTAHIHLVLRYSL